MISEKQSDYSWCSKSPPPSQKHHLRCGCTAWSPSQWSDKNLCSSSTRCVLKRRMLRDSQLYSSGQFGGHYCGGMKSLSPETARHSFPMRSVCKHCPDVKCKISAREPHDDRKQPTMHSILSLNPSPQTPIYGKLSALLNILLKNIGN